MKAASIQEIKEELVSIQPKQLLELCLKLARFKKENKELLTYLLFEAHDQHSYIESVKMEMDEDFAELPVSNFYLMKKALRKILKKIALHSRFTGSKQAEAEMLIYFCSQFKNKGLTEKRSTVLINLYAQQLKKIAAAISALHDDLHFDYKKRLEELK